MNGPRGRYHRAAGRRVRHVFCPQRCSLTRAGMPCSSGLTVVSTSDSDSSGGTCTTVPDTVGVIRLGEWVLELLAKREVGAVVPKRLGEKRLLQEVVAGGGL